MTISSIQLYDLLSEQLGKEKAKTLVSFVEAKIDEGLKEKTSVFATKEDIQSIRTEIQIQINKLLIWLVATMIALSGIVIAAIKLI